MLVPAPKPIGHGYAAAGNATLIAMLVERGVHLEVTVCVRGST